MSATFHLSGMYPCFQIVLKGSRNISRVLFGIFLKKIYVKLSGPVAVPLRFLKPSINSCFVNGTLNSSSGLGYLASKGTFFFPNPVFLYEMLNQNYLYWNYCQMFLQIYQLFSD